MFGKGYFYKSSQDLPNRQKTSRHPKTIIFLIGFLTAILISSTATAASVTLAWDPPDPGPEGYMLFIRLSGTSYNYDAPALIAATTSCRVEGLVPGTTYYMVVRAYEGANYSGDSNEISYTPAVPAGLLSDATSTDNAGTQVGKKSKSTNKTVKTKSTDAVPAVSNLKLNSAD